MCTDPGNPEVGELFEECYQCEVISWKIPYVSYLDISVGSELRSPRISYKKATWALKMFPYGRKDQKCNGSRPMQMEIERLHSQVPVHKFFYRIFFKNHAECCDDAPYESVEFNLKRKKTYKNFDRRRDNHEERNVDFKSWNTLLYHGKTFRRDDTVTLVLQVLTRKEDITGLHFETEEDLRSKLNKSEEPMESVGEIFTESFDEKVVAWKLPKVQSVPAEVDSRVHSPIFNFAGAGWILKLFMYGQTAFNTKSHIDVVIQKMYKSNPLRTISVLYKTFFQFYDEAKTLLQDFYLKESYYKSEGLEGYFTHDSGYTEEHVLRIMSHKACLDNASSQRNDGTQFLVFVFRCPKEAGIRLNFEMEPVQTAFKAVEETFLKEPMPIASTFGGCGQTIFENSGKPEVGKITKELFECEIITWKVPDVLYLINSNRHSPLFSFKGATWILRLNSGEYLWPKHFLTVELERLHSQIPQHNFFCKFYFKSHNFSLSYATDNSSGSCAFDSCHTRRAFLNENIFALFQRNKRNDTFVLVFEIYTEKNIVTELEFQTESYEETLAAENIRKVYSERPLGELVRESLNVEVIAWKIPNVLSLAVEVDNEVQSPSFLLAGACWNLKLFPYGHTKLQSEGNVDVVIERLKSQFSRHLVSYRIFFQAYDKKFDEEEYCLEDYFKTCYESGTGLFTFDPNHTQENIACVASYADLFYLVAPKRQCNTVVLLCDFRVKKETRIELDQNVRESVTSVAESSKETLKYEPLAFASLPPESSKETLNYEPVPFASLSSGFSFPPRNSISIRNKKFLQDMKELLIKHEDCDVILRVKGREFPAHKVILKARSPVFASALKNATNEKDTCTLDIEDCDPSCFSDFLHFLYSGCVENLSTTNVFSLFSAADKFDVQDLKSKCMVFMKKSLSVDTCHETNCIALA